MLSSCRPVLLPSHTPDHDTAHAAKHQSASMSSCPAILLIMTLLPLPNTRVPPCPACIQQATDSLHTAGSWQIISIQIPGFLVAVQFEIILILKKRCLYHYEPFSIKNKKTMRQIEMHWHAPCYNYSLVAKDID